MYHSCFCPDFQALMGHIYNCYKKGDNLSSSKIIKENFTSVNGVNLYFETKGKGDALLLIHAGVGDSRMWDSQFEALSKTHFVIRCDLRGFGQSDMQPGTFSYYEDISALLNYLNVEKASLIGISFGGYVAIDFSLAYPEKVKSLILGSPALGGYKFKTEEVLAFFEVENEALEHGDLAKATELNLKMWVDGPNRTIEEVRDKMREQVREMQMNIFSQPEVDKVEEKELSPPAVDRLQELAMPLLIIIGDNDVKEFQMISNFIAKSVKKVKKFVISEAAHLPNMEKPDKFNRIVIDFLSDI